MQKRNHRPRTDWARVPNARAGKGQKVGNRYDFSTYLKKVGDFVETYPMSYEDMMKVKYAAYIWAFRKHCKVRTERFYHPNKQYSLLIEVTSAVRKPSVMRTSK